MTTARTMPTLSGTEAYVGAVVLAGANQATSVFKAAPTTSRGRISVLNLVPGNTNLTLAMTRVDLLVSVAAGNTSIFVPTLATIADIGSYTFNANDPAGPFFSFQRRGLGPLLVNFAAGVTVYWNDLNPATFPDAFHRPVTLMLVGQDIWAAC